VEKKKPIENEFEAGLPDDVDEEAVQNRRLIQHAQGVARQVALDPNDGMEL
jgi:type IV secretion system protein VirD4